MRKTFTSDMILKSEADFNFPVLIMNPLLTTAGHGVPQGNILGYLIKVSFTGKQISISRCEILEFHILLM